MGLILWFCKVSRSTTSRSVLCQSILLLVLRANVTTTMRAITGDDRRRRQLLLMDWHDNHGGVRWWDGDGGDDREGNENTCVTDSHWYTGHTVQDPRCVHFSRRHRKHWSSRLFTPISRDSTTSCNVINSCSYTFLPHGYTRYILKYLCTVPVNGGAKITSTHLCTIASDPLPHNTTSISTVGTQQNPYIVDPQIDVI